MNGNDPWTSSRSKTCLSLEAWLMHDRTCSLLSLTHPVDKPPPHWPRTYHAYIIQSSEKIISVKNGKYVFSITLNIFLLWQEGCWIQFGCTRQKGEFISFKLSKKVTTKIYNFLRYEDAETSPAVHSPKFMSSPVNVSYKGWWTYPYYSCAAKRWLISYSVPIPRHGWVCLLFEHDIEREIKEMNNCVCGRQNRE